jgi:carbon-monoxide dehydrogenase small subunit
MVRRIARRMGRRRRAIKKAKRMVKKGSARKGPKAPPSMAKRHIVITVNGHPREVTVRPNVTLLDVLRKDLNLKGTNKGCGTGDCGACTVIMDGKAVNSCLVLAVDADGKRITTIEGLAPPGELHPVQRAFIDNGAVQCGFCTPGMILTAKAFLDTNPDPTEEECKRAISGNLCRCTGYKKIVEAIRMAAEVMRHDR